MSQFDDLKDDDGYAAGAANSADDITWWNLMGYSSEGTLESSILDAGTVHSWDTFASDGLEPSGTSLSFQLRSSQNSDSMGVWSDTLTTPCNLDSILAASTNFVQYGVVLQTTNPHVTPVLNDVTIAYTAFVNIGDINVDEITCWGLEPGANPSFGKFSVRVSLPQSEMVDLLLYDVAGRLIAEDSQELLDGTHSLFSATFLRDFTATVRVVVLK